MINIQYLYYFSSDDLCLIETKRTDLSSSASLSDIYKWLVYSKTTQKLSALRFLKMNKDESLECRSFAEGEFKFDSSTAALTYFGKHYQLVRQDPSLIDPSLDETIKKFLLGLAQND
jgi:hypothetical protein